ncbi:MAG: hypothetical protein JWM32_37 [Verrucomicrobia bacterium]|nr:hypothetical protein [Verrucomicrobiota bacterium]
MKYGFHRNEVQARIDREAAEWLVKRERGLTAPEQDAYFQWLAAAPQHGEALAQHQQTWIEFNLLAQWKPEHSAEPNPDLLARHRHQVIRPIWQVILAAAASVAVALWAPWRQPHLAPTPARAQTVATAYERRVLEDGSVIELNAGTRLSVEFTRGERRVHLVQGEATFSVAKNPARPFIVNAQGINVRAVGTAFNVRLGQKHVEVLVTEGKVSVDDAVKGISLLPATANGQPPVLEAGRKVLVETQPAHFVASAPVAVSSSEITRLLAWQPELLDFNLTPLSEVVAAFNRRNTVQIELADREFASMPIVASFRSDNVDSFVRLLEVTAGVKAQRVGDRIILRKNP